MPYIAVGWNDFYNVGRDNHNGYHELIIHDGDEVETYGSLHDHGVEECYEVIRPGFSTCVQCIPARFIVTRPPENMTEPQKVMMTWYIVMHAQRIAPAINGARALNREELASHIVTRINCTIEAARNFVDDVTRRIYWSVNIPDCDDDDDDDEYGMDYDDEEGTSD